MTREKTCDKERDNVLGQGYGPVTRIWTWDTDIDLGQGHGPGTKTWT